MSSSKTGERNKARTIAIQATTGFESRIGCPLRVLESFGESWESTISLAAAGHLWPKVRETEAESGEAPAAFRPPIGSVAKASVAKMGRPTFVRKSY
jgi:hypothetical protein